RVIDGHRVLQTSAMWRSSQSTTVMTAAALVTVWTALGTIVILSRTKGCPQDLLATGRAIYVPITATLVAALLVSHLPKAHRWPRMGATEPVLSLVRSPPSTPYCDRGVGRRA